VKEVVDQVISDGWYGEHIEAQLKDLPSICCDNNTFVNRIQHCYRNMEIDLNQDTLVNLFASNIFPDIPTMFSKNDSRFLNIVFINLPARLASYIKKRCGVVNVTCVQALTDQEKGPLRYIAGAVIKQVVSSSEQVQCIVGEGPAFNAHSPGFKRIHAKHRSRGFVESL
jgi:hypothetical protein